MITLKENFLNENIFRGLTHHAGAYMLYSKDDFNTIQDRVEVYGLGIGGIEVFDIEATTLYGVKTCEEYTSNILDISWAKTALKELQNLEEDVELYYTATFFVPIDMLTSDKKILIEHGIKYNVTILYKHKSYKLKSLLEIGSDLFRAKLFDGSKMTLESDDFKIVNSLLYS